MISSNLVSVRRILIGVSIRRSGVGALVGLVLAAASSVGSMPALHAQATTPQAAPVPTPERESPKRATLREAADNLEKLARSEKDATKRSAYLQQAGVIRKRLAEGDFQAGHRILLFVVGDSALSDTFTVRSDQKLQLPNLPEISLTGVLDSELQGYLATQLAQYIRNPSVRAQALLRVQVSGDVANPGFYAIRTDTPVSDVVMNAGGPTQSADMNKTELRRGSSVVVPRGGIQTAIQKELTMSDIGARPGDELYVPAKPSGDRWQKLVAVSASIMGLVWAIVYLADR
jgi:polysaccharide export outer membrane protein